jgi:formate-dependent nitrite reductase cytochrome c552 subunit
MSQHSKTVQKCGEKKRAFLWDYKEKVGCADCGLHDPRILQFDHVRGKKLINAQPALKKLSATIWRSMSWKQIAKELTKCEVVCANCHLIRTWKRNNWLPPKEKLKSFG